MSPALWVGGLRKVLGSQDLGGLASGHCWEERGIRRMGSDADTASFFELMIKNNN